MPHRRGKNICGRNNGCTRWRQQSYEMTLTEPPSYSSKRTTNREDEGGSSVVSRVRGSFSVHIFSRNQVGPRLKTPVANTNMYRFVDGKIEDD